jgi:hypothetical protein
MWNARIRVAIVLAVLAQSGYGQWLRYPTPGIPRTRDGKANLTAPAPRASDGKPDVSGIWQAEATPSGELKSLFGPGLDALSVPGDDILKFSKYAISILADFKAEEAPMRPEAAKIVKHRFETFGFENPTAACKPAGGPFGGLLPFPSKFVQTPGTIVIALEADGAIRQIFTDGRKHTADPQPTWMGYSVGHWGGDTLVADTVGFNDKGWLDASGHPRSEAMHVVERYRRRDFGHMDVQVTFDDSKFYTRPFSIRYTMDLLPDTEIAETICAENEKDLPHIAR